MHYPRGRCSADHFKRSDHLNRFRPIIELFTDSKICITLSSDSFFLCGNRQAANYWNPETVRLKRTTLFCLYKTPGNIMSARV